VRTPIRTLNITIVYKPLKWSLSMFPSLQRRGKEERDKKREGHKEREGEMKGSSP